MKTSCCFLVAWFLCVASSGRTQLYEGEACRFNDGTQGVCRSVAGCPGAQEMITSGRRPKICSFVDQEPIVCCDPTFRKPTADPGITPTTTLRRTRRNKLTRTTERQFISMVNKSTIAGRKCEEYERYVYWQVQSQTLSFDGTPEVYNSTECSIVGQTLIIGGVKAGPKEFPHMAALGYGAIKDVQWKCGGSLISERFVLTAAHCLSAQGIGRVSFVRLGDLNLHSLEDDARPLTIAVAERIKHEGYKPPAQYNDIALLKLESDVTFSPYIRPACLHTIPGNPQGKPNATASGWESSTRL